MSTEDPRIARLRVYANLTGRGAPMRLPDLAALFAAYDEQARKIDAALALQSTTLRWSSDGSDTGHSAVDADEMRAALTAPEKPEGDTDE